jgi:hypothetical protein
MTITRFLLPGVVLGAFAVPGSAQFGGSSGPRYPDLVPSVRSDEPLLPPRQQFPPTVRPAAVASLEQMAVPQPGGAVPTDPVGTLNGGPMQYAPGLPVGSYPSPYYTDGPGCCGPLGRDGRIGYEVYTFTGANFVFGPGLPAKLRTGVSVGGGARTLFFTPDHTAAWTVDLGLSYTHNYGTQAPQNLFLRASPIVNTTTGVVTPVADPLRPAFIREIHRESFNFNLGRDWWLWGAGNTGGETGTNIRVGGWVGGRYGSSHVDLIPLDEIAGYSRRQNVFEGVVVGGHATFETPMGGWILFGGVRAEYGYDWTNLVPPLQGNLNNINIQLTLGIRF